MNARRRAHVVAAVALTALLAVACGPRHYATLTDRAEPLRARFNADVGHTRVMMLVAPT